MFGLSLLAALAISPSSPPTDFAESWTAVSNAISNRYYARNTRKEEMEKRLAVYAPLASAATSEDEFSKCVNKMIVEFGDSHFDFYTKNDQGYYLMDQLAGGRNREPAKMPNIDAWFRPAGDGYTLQMVLEGGEAAKAGLRKGDVIMTIDNAPFSPIAALSDKIGKTINVRARRGNQDISAAVTVKESSTEDMFVNATNASIRVIERDGKKFGYIHVWTMLGSRMINALKDAVSGPLKDTDYFILDIRDGFGGRPEGFGDFFYDVSTGGGGSRRNQPIIYEKPMALLINEGSRSAKEMFSAYVKKSGRATLIGANTAGHVLGTQPTRIGDWGYLEMPMVNVQVNGQTLEKVGVAPDIEVKPEFDANGQDLVIEKAIQTLLQKR